MRLPEEPIEEYEQGNLTARQLMQELAGFDKWILGMDRLEDGGFVVRVYKDEKGSSFINLFSKPEYKELYGEIWGKEYIEGESLVLNGFWIFQNLPTAVDYMNLDPDTEHSLVYKKEQFELLKEIGKLVELDIPLSNIFHAKREELNYLEKDFAKIANHPDFYMILKGTQTPLAPDDRNRKILPIFTSEKAALLFLEWLNEDKGVELKIAKFQGRDLFDRIEKMNLDGIVFNCMGPITPIAFTMEFCKKINSLIKKS